jgi:hypothetical protein
MYNLGRSVSQIVTEVLKTTDLQMSDPYYSSLHGKKVHELCGCRVFCHVIKICKLHNFIYAYMYLVFIFIHKIFKL